MENDNSKVETPELNKNFDNAKTADSAEAPVFTDNITPGEKAEQPENKDKSIVEKMSIKELKDFIIKSFTFFDDPRLSVGKLNERLDTKEKIKKAVDEGVDGLNLGVIEEVLIANGLDNHYPLYYVTGRTYRGLAIEFASKLCEDFDCKSAGEKALAQAVANAYVRIMELSTQMHRCISFAGAEIATKQTNDYYSMIGKEIDRAYRHFLATITTLKQFKTPAIEINLKSKNTFLAQNQQLNINPKEKNDENIKPK